MMLVKLELVSYDVEFSNNSYKIAVRRSIINQMLRCAPGYIATLPALNFELEQMAINAGNFVHTIESDETTYLEQKRQCKGLKHISNYNETALEFFSKRPYKKYSFVYLDFCSQWSREIQATLGYVNAPVVAITLLMRWEGYQKHLFRSMNRMEAYEHIFKFFGYQIVESYKYQGGVNSPMCTFVLYKLDYNA